MRNSEATLTRPEDITRLFVERVNADTLTDWQCCTSRTRSSASLW